VQAKHAIIRKMLLHTARVVTTAADTSTLRVCTHEVSCCTAVLKSGDLYTITPPRLILLCTTTQRYCAMCMLINYSHLKWWFRRIYTYLHSTASQSPRLPTSSFLPSTSATSAVVPQYQPLVLHSSRNCCTEQ
jgi:hypothetical protein